MPESDDGVILDGLTGPEVTETRQQTPEYATYRLNERGVGKPRKVRLLAGETPEEAIARDRRERPAATTSGRKGRRRPDQAPRPSGRKAAGTPGPSDSELQAMLAELLAMPALPAAMVLKCSYCAQHFATSADPTARELMTLAKTNAGLHAFLIRLYTAWSSISYGAIIAMYVGKPLLHHAAPEPMLAAAGPVFGVPPRPSTMDPHPHQHHAAPEDRWAPPVTNRPMQGRPAPNAAAAAPTQPPPDLSAEPPADESDESGAFTPDGA
jgi:hypothetical protein